MNCVQLTGNLCKDLKITYSKSNKAFLENTLGVAKERKNEDGSRDTDFINFVAFEQKAEYLSNYAKKGDKIEITGKLRVDNWKDEEGKSHNKVYVVADSVSILTSRTKEPNKDEKPF